MVMKAVRPDPQHAELEQQPRGDGDTVTRLDDAFPSESEAMSLITRGQTAPSVSQSGDRTRVYALMALALAAVLAIGAALWMRSGQAGANAGSLQVRTDVAGADVTIDGSHRGKTPLLLSLATGEHSIRVQQGSLSRTLPVSIEERTTVVQHISWPATVTTALTTGGIDITSDPRGQTVSIDGQPRGVTPLSVTDLPVGDHEVMIRKDATTIRRTVRVEAGATASLMITAGAAGVSSGWLAVSVPIPLQIYEGTRLIGSTESDRILVPAGSHTYDLANEALGFRVSRVVQVAAGQTASITVALPRGTINVNAVPWAQVWLDGQPLGETPIGNVSWTIGTHEIILRHPDLGERRVSTTITTANPARVAVDMRKPQ